MDLFPLTPAVGATALRHVSLLAHTQIYIFLPCQWTFAMALSSFQVIALVAATTTFVLKHYFGGSWWYVIPLFITFFITWNAYRMFVYERYLSPLARLPGPKAALIRK